MEECSKILVILTISYKASGMWKSILAVKLEFEKWIRYRVHNGHLVSFWDEVWCGNLQLNQQFGALYSSDRRQNSVIADQLLEV